MLSLQSVVYIDMLFLLNFFIDSVLLYLSSVILRRPLRPARLAAVSALSALYAVLMFFPRLSFMFSTLCKLLFITFAAFLAFPSGNAVRVMKNTAVTLSVFSAAGGIMLALIFTGNFGTVLGAAVSNGEIYIDIGLSGLILGISVTYTVVCVSAFLIKQNTDLKAKCRDLTIRVGKRSATVHALADSGCMLCEPISGAPVLIINQKTAHELLPNTFFKVSERGFADLNGIDTEFLKFYRTIPFRTIGGEGGTMHGFIPNEIFAEGKKITHAAVAVSKYPVSDGAFDAVFNPELLNYTEVYHENKISVNDSTNTRRLCRSASGRT